VMENNFSKIAFLATMAVIPIVVGVTLAGLLVEDLYSDLSVSMQVQGRGQDIITLLFVVPMLVLSMIKAYRGVLNGILILAGLHAYLIYSYFVYSAGIPFNVMYLAYVAILLLSTMSIISIISSLNMNKVASAFSEDIPNKLVAYYMIISAVLVALMWLGTIIISGMINGSLPKNVLEDTNGYLMVQTLDLGLVVPFGVFAGMLLLKKTKWSYLLSAIFMVKVTTLCLAIIAMVFVMKREGLAVDLVQIIVFSVLLILSLIMLFLFFNSLNSNQVSD